MRIPGASKQNLRIAGTHRQIGNANFGPRIERLGPINPSIDGFVDATLFVRTISVTERSYVNHGRILRINHDPADLPRVVQADVRPGSAAIRTFVDAVAGRQIGTDVGLAGSRVDGFGIGWRHSDGSD